MNREIKFRIWDRKLKMMTHFQDWDFEREYTLLAFNAKEQKERNWSYGDMPHNKEDCVLMQFTGLHDKNGKEIYEGDVVKFSKGFSLSDGEQVMIHEITWCEPYAAFGVHGMLFNAMNLFPREVIGNVYENENLLK